MIDGQNVLDKPVKSNMRTFDSIWKIATDQGDDCTTGSLLGYSSFKENYKVIVIDLIKHQPVNADPKAIQ